MLHFLHLHGGGAHGHMHWLLPIALAAVAVELVWRLAVARKGYDFRGAGITIGVAVGHLLFGALGSAAIASVFGLVWTLTPLHWPLGDWRTWAVGFLAVEFAYYWYHRLSHEVRWLWATHAVHHTPEEITFLSAIRLGWTNLISAGWLVYAPVVLLGFDPRLVLLILAIDLRFQFFLHTEAKISLGPLEWVLNTPAHHQIHHASNPEYLDKNYGGAVIIFDRMFGTFAKALPQTQIRYGLVRPVGTNNPFILAVAEWRRLFEDMRQAPTVLAAARIAIGRP